MVYFKILIPNFTGLSQYFFAMEVSSKPIYKVEFLGNKKIIVIKGEKKVQPDYPHCLILHCVESSDFWDQVLGIADDPHKCSISNTATAIDSMKGSMRPEIIFQAICAKAVWSKNVNR